MRRDSEVHRYQRAIRSSRVRGREIATRCISVALVALLVQPPVANAADKTDIATSALEFGGSVGKLLWVTVENRSAVNTSDADRYMSLAKRVKEQIDYGRVSSSLVTANFKVIGTTLAYAAVVDPEPTSKAVAGIAAWGAKKTGDALGQAVIAQSQQQAKAILAQGLKNSGLSANELKHMTADQLRVRVADLQIGGQKLRDVLKDDPDSLSMLQANAVDIATNISVETLAQAQGTAADVQTIKQELAQTRKQIDDFQGEVKTHLENVDKRLSGLEIATADANQKLDALKTAVQGNSKAIQTLAQVSYSGWTTAQKLQAVESGLFPNLTDAQKTALTDSLKADQKREALLDGVQHAARDLGNLAAIASNLGLPSDVITGLKGAQNVATSIAQFATGDVLGGLASVTSLVGLGAPDANAERYAAMMKYLDQKFAEVNKKLDEIIQLQVQTLKALAALADDLQKFQKDVFAQLDRIENTVLRNEKLLQALLRSQWEKCFGFINGTSLNGQFTIPTRDVLIGVIGNTNIGDYASNCYSKMAGFLDANVKSAKWAGQIIDAGNFPTDSIAAEPELQKSWVAFESQRINAYTTARDFVLQALPDASTSPAEYLARFSQPVVDTSFANQLDSTLAKKDNVDRFVSFKCNEKDVLSPALTELLCFGIVEGAATAPLSTRWQDLLGAALIGPYSTGLIDTGIALATISDFATKTNQGSFVFARPQQIVNFSRDGATPQLRSALDQHKGLNLLQKLRWLAEAYVLQQSITYGDYTAKLAEHELYDPATKSLNTDPKVIAGSSKQQALAAMRANPVLARNVVMLAMRHAIKDSLGGVEKADAFQYNQTYYALALLDFVGPQACNGSDLPRQKLGELFPNWRFEYFVTNDQKLKDTSLNNCPTEFEPAPNISTPQFPARGSGVGVAIADFYVLIPSPLNLSSGVFEQADSVRLALQYRDRINQAIIDRTIADTVREVSNNADKPQEAAASTAFALLNEGWDWTKRKKSQ